MTNGVNIFELADRGSAISALMAKYGAKTEQELQQILKRAYYEGAALVTDATYDKLFPVDPLGYQVQATIWPKFTHQVESIAMPKVKQIEVANQYIQDANYRVQSIEHKLDGINMKLYYEHGQLVHAVTRGSGVEGEDILPNAIKFKNVPKHINTTASRLAVEGEITITADDFNLIKQNAGAEYSNRRNTAAGVARRLDGQNSENLSFYAYTLYKLVNGKLDRMPVLDGRQELKQLGFAVPVNLLDTGKSLEELYIETAAIRDTNPAYIIDGLVIKSGEHQFALKFPANTGETTITGYRWELGSTYKLIPVALYDTITIGGANYSKATLASARNFIDTNAPVGSTVEIARANEVIPYLKTVVTRSDNPLDVPTHCPVCGQPLDWVGAHLVCNNENCKSRFNSKCERILAVLDIRGFKSATINDLAQKAVITDPIQILTITPDQLRQAGKSERVAVNIAAVVKDKVKQMSDAVIVFMLNLPGISYGSILELEKAAVAKGKTLLQVIESQAQEDVQLIFSVLKSAKGTTLTKYMNTTEGQAFYNAVKATVKQ